jgi:hypothetical protein
MHDRGELASTLASAEGGSSALASTTLACGAGGSVSAIMPPQAVAQRRLAKSIFSRLRTFNGSTE